MHTPSPRSTLFFLLLTFAMLWVPVGQHDFLYAHWMKVGTFAAPFLLFTAAAFRGSAEVALGRDVKVWSLWMLIAYIIHQFEEHWVDLFGNVYAFHATVNGLIMGIFEVSEPPLTEAGIFVINTSLVWLVGALAIWRSPKHVFPALAMASVIVINAASHILVGLGKASYNPGLLTSVLVFLPLGGFVYARVLKERVASTRELVASLIWGILAHVIMVGGLVAGGVFGLFPESVYFVALIAWSLVPVFLFRSPDGFSKQ
ncbi:MAG: HXXEE domain-containing protein [Myxococcota bacterium]